MRKSFVDTAEHERTRFQSKILKSKLKEFCRVNHVGFSDSVNNFFQPDFAVKLDNKCTVLVHVHDPMPGSEIQWKSIDQQLQQADKKLLVCTDNFVPKNINTYSNVVFYQSLAFLGVKHFHINEKWFSELSQNAKPSKLFNCFINRVEPVRQSWFYFLHQYELLDQGYVSFLLFNHDMTDLTELELFDHNHKQELYQLDHFEKSYKSLRSRVPFKNFVENGLLWDKICDSKYSLVLDTSAPDNNLPLCFISEKTARTVMLPSLDLLFVQSGTLTHLDSMGIKTNSYSLNIDNLCWQDRQTKILDELVKDTCEYNFKNLLESAQNNHHVFKTIYEQHKEFNDELFDKIVALQKSGT